MQTVMEANARILEEKDDAPLELDADFGGAENPQCLSLVPRYLHTGSCASEKAGLRVARTCGWTNALG